MGLPYSKYPAMYFYINNFFLITAAHDLSYQTTVCQSVTIPPYTQYLPNSQIQLDHSENGVDETSTTIFKVLEGLAIDERYTLHNSEVIHNFSLQWIFFYVLHKVSLGYIRLSLG